MKFSPLDITIFVAFFGVVLFVSMYKSRKERTGEDYFLASRGLLWPFIGLSLIAANISSEHFVGMSGQGAGSVGLAIAISVAIGDKIEGVRCRCGLGTIVGQRPDCAAAT